MFFNFFDKNEQEVNIKFLIKLKKLTPKPLNCYMRCVGKMEDWLRALL